MGAIIFVFIRQTKENEKQTKSSHTLTNHLKKKDELTNGRKNQHKTNQPDLSFRLVNEIH